MAKDFKNAALSFITSAASEDEDIEESSAENISPIKDIDRKKIPEQEQETTVITMSDKKKKRERKSRRVNLLMYPSLVDSLKAKAEEEDTSMNDILCRAAEEFLQNHYKN